MFELIDSGQLPRAPEHDCSYLPGRLAQSEGFTARELDAELYHDLMDRGFRRSGVFVYRPCCQGCNACVPLRIAVDTFKPSDSQKRAVRRNRDLSIHVAAPDYSPEKLDLYQRYMAHQHPGSPQSSDGQGLRDFLYSSIVNTAEVEYRKDGRLVAVSILDVCHFSVSSVYHYFDPQESQRSLGVYSVVAEIGLAREMGVPYLYMGYWIDGCPTMQYKAKFGPHELLINGKWQAG